MGSMIEHWSMQNRAFGLNCANIEMFPVDSFCLVEHKQGKWMAKVGKLWQRINLIKVGCRITSMIRM
jgi:hypothetical protein